MSSHSPFEKFKILLCSKHFIFRIYTSQYNYILNFQEVKNNILKITLAMNYLINIFQKENFD